MSKFEKMQIKNEDDSGEFEVQYNPERYAIEKTSVWQEKGRKATLVYGGHARKTVTFELFFDTR